MPDRLETAHPAGDSAAQHSTRILSHKTLLYDLYCILGGVAATTKTLKVGTAVNVLPLNPPLLLARATSTLHDIAQGRLLLGTGVGWAAEEFARMGVPFNERGARLDETIEILRKAWKGGFFEHNGRHFRFEGLQISPHPIHIPLIIGGHAPQALRRAAAVGDGWINSARIELDLAMRLRDEIEANRIKLGTDKRKFEYYVRPSKMTDAGIDAFIQEGFTNLLLTLGTDEEEEDGGLGTKLWSVDPSISIAAKRAHLQKIADRIGVGAR